MIKLITPYDLKRPAILCLAGNLCTPSVFDSISAPVSYQKLYLDYLGAPGPWDMDSMGKELVQLVERLSLKKVILAGYSAGGVLALSAAAKKPELFAGMLLSNTGPCSEGHGSPNFVKELWDNFENDDYMRSFLRSCFHASISRKQEDKLLSYTRTVSKEAACAVSESLRKVDYRNALSQYENPVVIAHGRLDRRRQMSSVKLMQDCLRDTYVVLLETGHTPMMEDAKAYEAALRECVRLVEEKSKSGVQ